MTKAPLTKRITPTQAAVGAGLLALMLTGGMFLPVALWLLVGAGAAATVGVGYKTVFYRGRK